MKTKIIDMKDDIIKQLVKMTPEEVEEQINKI